MPDIDITVSNSTAEINVLVDSAISICANYIDKINTVANNVSNINSVNNNATNINAVNSNKTNIDAVAGNQTNINAVNSNKTNIDTVAGSNTAVTTCATNISAITAAPVYATSASTSANTATSQATIATQQANLAKQYAEETHGQSDVMVENVRAIPAYANYGYTQTESKGLADLKQYNTNSVKSGIDTIKADNYTVVGTPTITPDGILQLSDNSNYINSSLTTNALSGKSWEIYTKVYWNGRNNGTTNTFGIGDIYSYFRITQTQELVFNAYLASDNSQVYKAVFNPTLFSGPGWYYLRLTFDYATGTYKGYAGKEANDLTELISITKGAGAEIRYLNNSHYILFSRSTTLNHEQDLNSFKIYVDGSLIYQPCLKIPYNQSKTGLKIVSEAYRDRVQDMYNQFGWANYYTLSDTNFTVPMGENLDGHVTKVDWYKNGTTSWEYDTNLDCTETGSCTSGTAVTLPKAMADTNYTLSVPYSAKTKTGFTPTQTGEYIAKGKVVLG